MTFLQKALLPLSIATAVVLSGVHAKDLATPLEKTLDGHEASAKAAADWHNHIDKQTGKTLVKVSLDSQQADSRALRAVRHTPKPKSLLAARLMSWWQMYGLTLG